MNDKELQLLVALLTDRLIEFRQWSAYNNDKYIDEILAMEAIIAGIAEDLEDDK